MVCFIPIVADQNMGARRDERWRPKPGSALWAAMILTLAAALFYAPILLGLATFPDGDFTHHFLPFSLFQRQELAAGRLPVWNPYTYSGHPFLADVQAAVFYPVSNALLAITLPIAGASARLYFLELEAIFHSVLAGFFIYLLVRELTTQPMAGLLAGLCFMLSGYLTGYPPLQLAVLRTAIWLPLICWCLLVAFAAPQRWRYWIGAAVATAVSFLGGHAQTFLFVAYAVAAWALFLLVAQAVSERRRSVKRQSIAQITGLVGYVLLSVALTAPQLLPGIEFARLSVRNVAEYSFLSGGFPLQDSWQILLPGVLTQYSPLYIGVIGLGLAGAAVTAALAGQPAESGPVETARVLNTRATILFFAALTVVGLVVSYGGNGFLYPLFYRLLPGWNLFRGQERAAYLVAYGLSVLAGYGIGVLPTFSRLIRQRYALAYGAVVAAGVYAFGMLWQLFGRTAIGRSEYLVIALVTLALAMTFCLTLWIEGWSDRRVFWLCALVTGNLVWANFATNLDATSPARKVLFSPEMEALVNAAATAEDPGTRVYNEYRVYEDYGMRFGVEDVWGSSPLRLARYAGLFENFPLDRMWALLGVEHVLTWRKELFGPSEMLGQFPQASDTTYLHRLPTPHARAWLVPRVEPATDDRARELLSDHQFDLDATALVPTEVLTATVAMQPGDSAVGMEQVQPGHLRIEVDSEYGGLLIVSENWMPGWQVREETCDGQNCAGASSVAPELPLLQPVRTDLTLVGVMIPPGAITFDLVYAPASVQTGLWIGAGTLVLLVGGLVLRGLAHKTARAA